MFVTTASRINLANAITDLGVGPVPTILLETALSFPSFGVASTVWPGNALTARADFGAFETSGYFFRLEPKPMQVAALGERATPLLRKYDLVTRQSTRAQAVLDLPAFGINGSFSIDLAINRGPVFQPFGLASDITVPLGLRGVRSFGALSLDGEVFVPPLQVSGSMTLPIFGVQGEIGVPPAINSAITFSAFSLLGAFDRYYGVSGFDGFGTFATAGSGFQSPAILRGPEFPAFEAAGALDLDKIRIDGRPAFNAFGLAGEIEIPFALRGTVAFSAFAAQGELDLYYGLTGTSGFPAFALSGSISIPLELRGTLAFAAMSLGGILNIPTVELTGTIGFGEFDVIGRLEMPRALNGTLSFASFGTKALIITHERPPSNGGPSFNAGSFEQFGNARFGFGSDLTL